MISQILSAYDWDFCWQDTGTFWYLVGLIYRNWGFVGKNKSGIFKKNLVLLLGSYAEQYT
jgi:hypothetical protein